MGCVPRLVTSCWVGGEERDIHFNSMTYGQGAAAALPIWAKYMNAIYADPQLGYTQDEDFDIDEDFLKGEESAESDSLAVQVPSSVVKAPANATKTKKAEDAYFE